MSILQTTGPHLFPGREQFRQLPKPVYPPQEQAFATQSPLCRQLSNSLFDPRNTFRGFTGSAVRPVAENGASFQQAFAGANG